MILTALIISFTTVGFRCITAKNMILYFLRKPFEKANKVIQYIAKPFILCCTCMASVHTLLWYPFFIGEYNVEIFPVMLMVAFFNTLFYSIIENLE
tara:strand:- start:430 stop:717 length:288 start_codon:yes stop_codon:yes gene_type:complete